MLVVCCSKCHENLKTSFPLAANLWVELCRSFVKHRGTMGFTESRLPWTVPVFRRLEKLGYVMTADCAKEEGTVLVNVFGYNVEDGEDPYESFCIDRESHKHAIVS